LGEGELGAVSEGRTRDSDAQAGQEQTGRKSLALPELANSERRAQENHRQSRSGRKPPAQSWGRPPLRSPGGQNQ